MYGYIVPNPDDWYLDHSIHIFAYIYIYILTAFQELWTAKGAHEDLEDVAPQTYNDIYYNITN